MIIVRPTDGKPVKIGPTAFATEDLLQRYIYENPESLPLDTIQHGTRLLVLAREFPTASGPIDALGVDANGELYLIETKLFKNPDKRQVIAQVLDYGSALWHSDALEFRRRLDYEVNRQSGTPILDQIETYFGISPEDAAGLLDNIMEKQAQGVFRFVVLMDQLDDRLRDLITFMNRNSNFTVYGVELEFYQHADLEILLPRLHGAEVKKETRSPTKRAGRRWTEADFFQQADERLGPLETGVLRRLYEFMLSWADEIRWGTGQKISFGPIKIGLAGGRTLMNVYSDGMLEVNFPYLTSAGDTSFASILASQLERGGIHVRNDGLRHHIKIPFAMWREHPERLEHALDEMINAFQNSLGS